MAASLAPEKLHKQRPVEGEVRFYDNISTKHKVLKRTGISIPNLARDARSHDRPIPKAKAYNSSYALNSQKIEDFYKTVKRNRVGTNFAKIEKSMGRDNSRGSIYNINEGYNLESVHKTAFDLLNVKSIMQISNNSTGVESQASIAMSSMASLIKNPVH